MLQAKNHAGARPLYERILAVVPNDLYVIYQLTLALEGVGDLQAAADICDGGLRLDPNQPGLLSRRAAIARARGQFVLALDLYQRLRARHPDFPYVDAMVADQLALLGRGVDAIEAFDRALTLAPDNTQIQSDRLFVLNYFGLMTRASLFEEHRAWGAHHEAALRRTWRPHGQSLDPHRRLRIGYVSPDLRRHAVAYFIEGILRNHDRSNFEINAIDVSPHPEDQVTHRLRQLVDRWHRIGQKSDDEVAEFIRLNEFDILVDLSGHTAHNRLLVFARRPAPVQVSWFGYMNTTGLTSIDYRLTDGWLDPVGESEAFYTERLFRLPSMACFQPDPASPDVNSLPALQNGWVTIASLNQWTKVTEPTKDAWARILQDAPSARLVIVARGGDDSGVRGNILNEFSRRNVPTERIDVIGFQPIGDFLSMLSRIDFALDPFPYGGGTTTLHSAWMGVPMVTLESDSELGRSCSGILHALGVGELVAHTVESYSRIALELINDVARLARYRSELRDRFRASTLVDAEPVTRSVEAAWRSMWQEYCAQTR
jgi:predicted O-linked N-acetylglucosamine transferase (SPINDLY family)